MGAVENLKYDFLICFYQTIYHEDLQYCVIKIATWRIAGAIADQEKVT